MASKQVATLRKSVAALEAAGVKLMGKIADNEAALARKKIELAEAESATVVSSAVELGLPTGTAVEFFYGRAETKKQLSGIVLASKPADKGPTLYRVQTGEGFDAQVFTIQAAAIISHNYVPTPTVDVLDGVVADAS